MVAASLFASCSDGTPVDEPQVWPQAADLAQRDFLEGRDLQQPVEAFDYAAGFISERLLLAADGTYRIAMSTCTGGLLSQGRFRRDGFLVLLDSPEETSEGGALGGRRLFAVSWGERRYLIEDSYDAWLRFCNEVNAGDEPATDLRRHTNAFLRLGDELQPAPGLPGVPQMFRHLLLREPIEGRTVEALADGTAWVDLGSDDGLARDMVLWLPAMPVAPDLQPLWGGPSTVETVRVVEVEDSRCRVEVFVHPTWDVPAGLVVTSRRPPDA